MTGQITELRGKTIRFSWTDGPTGGMTQEHVFHNDGTVSWKAVGSAAKPKAADKAPESGDAKPSSPPAEQPRYFAQKINDAVWIVSYLSKSGFTLTATLNLSDQSLVAIASNDKSWFPVHGRFEVVR